MHPFQFISLSVRSIIQTARASPALRQSAVLLLGSLITGSLMGVALIIASRGLGPERFGVLSVSIALAALVAKMTDLGINQLIPRFLNRWHTDAKKTASVLAQIIRWRLWLTIITLGGGLMAVPVITKMLDYPYPYMIGWALVGGTILGWHDHLTLILASHHRFGWVSSLNVSQALFKLVGFSLTFFLSATNLPLIAAWYYLAPITGGAVAAWKFWPHVWVRPHNSPSAISRELIQFLKHAAVGVVAATLLANLDILFIQRHLTSYEAGVYSGALRIATFVSFAATAIGGVLNNRVSRYHDIATFRKYVQKSTLFVFLAVIGFVCYIPISRWLLLFTIGPAYLPGLTTMHLLVFSSFATMALTPYMSFFYAVDRPNYFSVSGVAQVSVIIIGNLLFLPQYGIQAAAWTKVAATLILGLITIWYLSKSLITPNHASPYR